MNRTITILAGLACFSFANLAFAQEMDHGHHHDHSDHPDKLVQAGTAPEVENPFHPIRLLLSNTESAGEVTIYEFALPAQSAGSPPHTHTLEDEYFYILSGTLDVLSNGDVLRLNTGDMAALNRGHTHMFWNGSDEANRFLVITTGSSFEAFMQSVSPRLSEAAPASPDDVGALIGQIAAEHGISITMENMPDEAAPYYAPPPRSPE